MDHGGAVQLAVSRTAVVTWPRKGRIQSTLALAGIVNGYLVS